MSEYTPTTDEVRKAYVSHEVQELRRRGKDEAHDSEMTTAEFDRWLAQVQAEAKSRALEDAADDWEDTTWQDDLAVLTLFIASCAALMVVIAA